MRIVHVTDTYLPKVGGIEAQVLGTASGQARAGHDVLVVTATSAGRSSPHGEPDAVRVGARIRRSARRTAREVVDSADVVHVHLSLISPLAVLCLHRAVRSAVPVAVTIHSMLPTTAPLPLLVQRWARRHPSIAWGAVSRSAAARAAALLGPDVDIELLPNSFEPGRWTALPAKALLAQASAPAQRPDDEHEQTIETGDVTEVVVAAVGRLVARKRPLALVRVVADAQRRLDRAGRPVRLRLVLVGRGPWARVIRPFSRRYGLSTWLDMPGALPHGQIAAVLAGADVFLSTATNESFGIAVLEARAAGVPVIARSGTGVAEVVVDGLEGVLADSDAGLAAALAALADDPARRARIAVHDRAEPPPHTWEDGLHRVDLAYKRAAALTAVPAGQR